MDRTPELEKVDTLAFIKTLQARCAALEDALRELVVGEGERPSLVDGIASTAASALPQLAELGHAAARKGRRVLGVGE